MNRIKWLGLSAGSPADHIGARPYGWRFAY